jgi:hypothetical protein
MTDSIEQVENKTEITINEVVYTLEDMNEELRVLVAHVSDLDGKINGSRFGLQQLEFSRSSFMNALVAGLEAPVEEVAAE